MTDKQITLSIPETLLEQATSAHIDIQSVLLEVLEYKLLNQVPPLLNEAEREAYLLSILASDRQEEAKQTLAQGQRILGLFEGQGGWISDDFTDSTSP
ncbi:MAG: hypothetical protein ABI947_10720 [Chloroflexota bacterium]